MEGICQVFTYVQSDPDYPAADYPCRDFALHVKIIFFKFYRNSVTVNRSTKKLLERMMNLLDEVLEIVLGQKRNFYIAVKETPFKKDFYKIVTLKEA